MSIVCVGKIKEAYLVEGMKEYGKRLSRYCKLHVIEVADEKTPEKASEKEAGLIKRMEGERLLRHLKEDAFVIVLEIDGEILDSVEFAKKMEDIALRRSGCIQFVIGGSLGLHETVTKRADMRLSFSKFTFPHQLMRLILLEQIYRAYKKRFA